MSPLSKLKNIIRQKDFERSWLPEHDVAFSNIKAAMASDTLLVHPSPTAQTETWCWCGPRATPTWGMDALKFLEQTT